MNTSTQRSRWVRARTVFRELAAGPLLLVIAIALVSSLASCGSSSKLATPAGASQRFLAMADDHAAQILQSAPEWSTQLGVSEGIGGRGFNQRLSDYSIAGNEQLKTLSANLYAELSGVDPTPLTGTAAVTYDVLHNAYRLAERQNAYSMGIASLLWVNPPYAADQLFGIHTGLPRLLISQHPIADVDSADAYLKRLSGLDDALMQMLELLGDNQRRDYVPPDFALRAMAGSAREFIKPEPTDHALVTSFVAQLEEKAFWSPKQIDAAAARAHHLLVTEVYPAYQRFADQLEMTQATANADAGLWRFVDGNELYQIALDNYGAQGFTPSEIHQLGLTDVARIRREMNAILVGLGHGEGSVAQRMAALAQSAEFQYESSDAGRAQILADLQIYVDAVYAKASDYFLALPTQKIEVRRIPTYEENAAGGAYYTPPSLDGSEPGVFWINLKEPRDWPRFLLPTLVYHEAVPGHHFQAASQLNVKDMPLIRNMMFFSDYGEGWALYAEELAVEMGLYDDDPYGNLGRLKMELYRAARLVVDTGLHDKRWTRERAVEWMIDTTGESRDSIRREIERYAVWPGQATAYKLGMIRFQQIRSDAQGRLGSDFDIRRFHQALLSEGTMPMAVLAERMRDWKPQP